MVPRAAIDGMMNEPLAGAVDKIVQAGRSKLQLPFKSWVDASHIEQVSIHILKSIHSILI